MSMITALDPRNLTTTTKRVYAGVVVLGLIAVIVSIVGASNAAHARYDGMEMCSAEATDDCLEALDGRVYDRRLSGERRYYFEPDGDGERVSLGKRSPGGISTATAQGLYDDGDFVGLQDGDGDRHYESSILDAPAPYLALFGGGLLVFLAGLLLLGREHRRG